MTQGAITQLLDKLERRGLIRRCPDGRLKRLVLTDTGRSLRDSVVPGQERFQAERFAALTAVEQRTLLTLLSKLQRAENADGYDHCDDVDEKHRVYSERAPTARYATPSDMRVVRAVTGANSWN